MIDFDALLRRAERELVEEEALVRTVKTGIVFSALAVAMRRYHGEPVSNTEILGLLEVLARHGKLYESLHIQNATPAAPPLREPAPDGAAAVDDLEKAPPSPEELSRSEDIRQALREAYPSFSAEEIEAIVQAQLRTADPGVVFRTDEELARHEAQQRNIFPGVPEGKPIEEFTMTEPVEPPSDLKPMES